MPALQSPWFIPHLIVYMAGYAMLAMAALMAVYLLFRWPVGAGHDGSRHSRLDRESPEREMGIADNLVYVGLAFLTFGMLFGALWAKEAWGHYWAWDPKETWAAITWLCYLLLFFKSSATQSTHSSTLSVSSVG